MTQFCTERREQLGQFMEHITAKLSSEKCEAKSDWRERDDTSLLVHMLEEIAELKVEVMCKRAARNPDAKEVRRLNAMGECVDIAAFAFFIWDKLQLEGSRECGERRDR